MVFSKHPFLQARITRIETPFQHALHSYQGLCPWSPDGSWLLYAGFDQLDRKAKIVGRDLREGRDIILGESPAYDYHTASYQQWVLSGAGIVYRDIQQASEGTAMAGLPTSNVQPSFYPGFEIRVVSASMQHGYGRYRGAAARLDLGEKKMEIFFSPEQAAECLPDDIAENCPYVIDHFVPNAEESLAFFKLCKPQPFRKAPGRIDDWGAFFSFDLHARSFRCLGQRISGHPQWMSDNRRIVNIMSPLDGSDNRWIVAQDALTGEIERLVDLPIEGAGHPVMSPNGRYLATDAYTVNHEVCPVYLIDLASGQTAEIARLDHSIKITETYQPKTIFRSNLHPVWSPDGKRLLVNCNQGGTQVGIFLLDHFL